MSIFSAGKGIYDRSDGIFGRDESRAGQLSGRDPRMLMAAQEEKRREDRRRNLLKPVEWIFDRLSTTNYLAANLTDQLLKAGRGEETNLKEAIWGSITGDAKMYFGDVLREHGPEGIDSPWFEDQKNKGTFIGNILGNLNTASVLGFAADLAVPVLPGFRSTKLAKAAAKQYADDALRATFQNPNVLETAARTMNVDDAARLRELSNNPNALRKFLTQKGSSKKSGVYDFSRKMNNAWKENYREGLRMGEDEMKKALTGLWAEVQSTGQRDVVTGVTKQYQQKLIKPLEDWLHQAIPENAARIRATSPEAFEIAKKGTSRAAKPDQFASQSAQTYLKRLDEVRSDKFFQDTFESINSVLRGDTKLENLNKELSDLVLPLFSDYAEKDLGMYMFESMADLATMKERINTLSQGAGRVQFSLFNKSLREKMRVESPTLNTMDKYRKALRGKYDNSRLQDAVAATLEGGPVGTLREIFGVRTPYQQALRTMELNNKADMRYNIRTMEDQIKKVFDQFDGDEKMMQDYFLFRARAQDMTKPLTLEADQYARQQLGLGRFSLELKPGEDPVQVAYDRIYELKASIPTNQYLEYKRHVKEYLDAKHLNPLDLARGENYQGMDRLRIFHERVENFFNHIDMVEQDLMHRGLMDFRESMDNYLPYMFRKVKGQGKTGEVVTRRVGDASSLRQTVGPQQAALKEEQILQYLYGMSAEDAHRIVMENGSTVVTDMKEIIMRRGMHHAAMVSEASMLDSLRQFGFNARGQGVPEALADPSLMAKLGLAEHTGTARGVFSRQGPDGYQYFFDADVQKVIQRTVEYIKEPGQFKKALEGYTNWWRGIATSSPGFHIRNLYSNYAMLYTEFGPKAFSPQYAYDGLIGATIGLKGPMAIADAGKDGGKIALRLQKQYGGWTMKELIQEAKRRGVISEASRGFTSDDPIRSLLKAQDLSPKQQMWKDWSPLSPHNKIFRLSRDTGAHVESATRFQAFLTELDQLTTMGGITEKVDWILDAAAETSRRVLLDYNDLTKAEREVMRMVVPFYTWIRKNLGNQINMIQNPEYWGRMATIPKMVELFRDDSIDESYLPEYMRNAGHFIIGHTAEGEVMTMWPNIPIFDLNKLPVAFEKGHIFGGPVFSGSELLNEISNMGHPGIKLISELAFNYDSFRQRPIRPTEQADRYFGIITRFPELAKVLDPILAAGNKGVGFVGGVDSSGVVQLNGQMVRGLDTAFPLANAINRYLQGLEQVGEHLFNENVISETIDAVMGATDPYEKTQAALRTMSFMMGIKASAYDEKESRLWRAMDIYGRAQDRRRAEEELSPLRDFRRIDWLNRNQKMVRRLGIY